MYLDNMLFKELENIGNGIIKNAGLINTPSNINEMHIFLNQVKKEIDNESFYGVLLGTIFFKFITSIDVRDRQTTSRIFEDLFASLFGVQPTDTSGRTNPPVPHYIEVYDALCQNEDWTISGDLSQNKREKADVLIDRYEISLKTLKGKAFGPDGIIIDRDYNQELNVGSLSFRALFKDILPDEKLASIRDRKGGLGSGTQMRNNVLNVILDCNKQSDFAKRLNAFMNYAYEEDIYIVLKSHYKITFYLIPGNSFRSTIIDLYNKKESEFEKVWYRWENNNLRLRWENLLKYMEEFNYPYYKIDIMLTKALNNDKIKTFDEEIQEAIKQSIQKLS